MVTRKRDYTFASDSGDIAQLEEQRTVNPCVNGSSPFIPAILLIVILETDYGNERSI